MAVYVFGSNVNGQLGLSQEVDSTHIPTALKFFENKKVVKIACGKLHTLVLCEGNELYSWGVNDDHALGRSGDEETPKRVKFNGNIIDMCAGASFSAVLTDRGQVFACGTYKSDSGIFGFTEEVKFQKRFKRYTGMKKISQICGGHNHIVMLDRDGNVFTVGTNDSNQLGTTTRLRNKKRSLIPSQISTVARGANPTFINGAAGGFHSILVDDEHKGYGWGSNFNGQLGNGQVKPSIKRVNVKLEGISQVACGANHSLFLTKKGELYGCGDNSFSQLGIKRTTEKIVIQPSLIMKNVTKIASGCDHSFAQVGNKLYSWGNSFDGEGGFDGIEITKPTEIEFDFGEIIDFKAGVDFTIVATKNK